MSSVLKSASLRGMSAAQIATEVARCRLEAQKIDRGARVTALRETVTCYEKTFGYSTKQMIDDVCSGKTAETGEVDKWLTAYNLLRVHEQT
jgi:hypothetical protein